MAQAKQKAYKWIVGIDEVGRGPLAGPVTVCAVAVPYAAYTAFRRHARAGGVTDSKKLTAQKRVVVAGQLRLLQRQNMLRASIASRSARVIDTQGISLVIRRLIAQTLKQLSVEPSHTFVLLDGSLRAPEDFIFQKTVIKGDAIHEIIGAASILAKVHRDAHMNRQTLKYPRYGFEVHKGYGTQAHRDAIAKHGLCDLHRKSFCKRFV